MDMPINVFSGKRPPRGSDVNDTWNREKTINGFCWFCFFCFFFFNFLLFFVVIDTMFSAMATK